MSTESEAKSLSELEREAEHARAGLIHTVDELHSRVSPEALKREVKEYARETSQDLLHGLEQRARENPLQTVALAAGLAYPVWRLLINIPAPILLVGAGVVLSQGWGPTHSGRYQGSGMRGRGEVGEELGGTGKRSMQHASSGISETVESLKAKTVGMAEDAKSAGMSGVSAFSDRATATINDATTSARDTASEAVAATRDALSETYQSGMEAAAGTADQLTETFRHSKETLIETMERHPLVVGGVGLLIGAVVASALPVTQTENRLFGPTSDNLKNSARDVASEGLNIAKSAAHDVYQEATSQAHEQGLSPEVFRRTVAHAGDKVKEVVQQASQTLDEAANRSSGSAGADEPWRTR